MDPSNDQRAPQIPATLPEAEGQELCVQCGLPLPQARSGKSPGGFCCYGCFLTHRITGISGEEGTPVLFLARLGLAGFLAMNVMTLTWALYGAQVPILFPIDPESRQAISYLVLILSVPVFLLIGIPYLKSAVEQIRRATPGVDTLIALGTSSAFGYSAYSTVTGGSAVYYDTATMVLVLVTFGRYLEASARVRTSTILRALFSGKVTSVRLAGDAINTLVHPESVSPGSLFRVLPGEDIPLDGVILDGETSVSEALLTGESSPLRKMKGDVILAGSTNYEGSILVRATSGGTDTFLARLRRLTEEVHRSRSPLQLTAERITYWFTPAILIVAVSSGIVWGAHQGLSTGLLNGLSVLLIACPCALGIGATLAGSVGYATAASRGIVLRSITALERSGQISTVFFDKTGTLTHGVLRVSDFFWDPGSPASRDTVLASAAALERHSEHPAGKAIVRYAEDVGAGACDVLETKVLPGKGIEGIIRTRELGRIQVSIQKEIMPIREYSKKGLIQFNTISYILINNIVSGYFRFEDALRATSAAAVNELRRDGIGSVIVSGDSRDAVKRIGKALAEGIEVHGDLLPGQKTDLIQERTGSGACVAMVGDGINDAPALAASALGIALRSGSDLSRLTADVTILDDDLRNVPWLMRFGRRVRSTIMWNFGWAFLYNTVGVGLAVAGLLEPVYSAGAMVVSSIMIVVNSSRLSRQNQRL